MSIINLNGENKFMSEEKKNLSLRPEDHKML